MAVSRDSLEYLNKAHIVIRNDKPAKADRYFAELIGSESLLLSLFFF
jgi:hypothetical protein